MSFTNSEADPIALPACFTTPRATRFTRVTAVTLRFPPERFFEALFFVVLFLEALFFVVLLREPLLLFFAAVRLREADLLADLRPVFFVLRDADFLVAPLRDDFLAPDLLDDLLDAFFALDAERLRPRDDLDAVAIALLLDHEDTVDAARGHERTSTTARFARTE
ncbi:MAG: hypothetical protein H7Z74_03650 [Anaerolineae bacterium]|nr:hypothetical protein [Gemmatimonadaceae bacterium]